MHVEIVCFFEISRSCPMSASVGSSAAAGTLFVLQMYAWLSGFHRLQHYALFLVVLRFVSCHRFTGPLFVMQTLLAVALHLCFVVYICVNACRHVLSASLLILMILAASQAWFCAAYKLLARIYVLHTTAAMKGAVHL
ncbi:hypothetical protein ARMSODRAFT_326767 [Armillaria solidipes]|uniref:Uncharacterized protein n=1 Tax=Armillaria solidipes TaxID=1076256 RepID=A0A2H3BTR5_9AGAR|nr:hypothetical protein ARMSODRAFT_326767 [Armillaria solidipes]